jgi:chromatin segregation and condensation protein Rec8/ScpA/Scc1 (kleisin family)
VTSMLVNNSALFNNENSIEASMNGEQMSKSLLQQGESLIDDINESSKHQVIENNSNLNELSRQLNAELDEFDQFGGPSSIFNNTNVEEMLTLGEHQDINLDSLTAEPQLQKKVNEEEGEEGEEEEEEGDDEEDEDEEEGGDQSQPATGENKKPTISPRRSPSSKKRHYRRSMNATLSKSIAADNEEIALDETMTNDSSKNLTKRAKTMVSILNKSFAKHDNVGLFELTKKNVRKHVAQKFYSLLVLKKYDIIEISQDETYGDIIISKGPKFENFH